jgi:hypothetical protein
MDAPQAVGKGEQGSATVRAGFTEVTLIPTNCAQLRFLTLMREFPPGVRPVVNAAGVPGEDCDSSSFDAVVRVPTWAAAEGAQW